MAKLYPPIISGTLPAFYLEENGADRFIKITVPFSMNRAVSPVQVKGFSLKIKTVQNSTYLYTTEIKNPLYFEMEDSAWVTFILQQSNSSVERKLITEDLKVGLFYKLQIAYIDQNDQVGNYSTIGISKFTTKPTLQINDFQIGKTNTHKYEYIGFYSQEGGDSTEKAYLYRFDIYDDADNLVITTGDQIHNSLNDVELYESYDKYEYNKDLQLNKVYKIQYTVQTNNNLILSSPRYRIMQRTTIDPDLKADIVASVNFDNGYVDIGLVGHRNSEGVEEIVTGSFILSRACLEDSNYSKWEEISRFKLGAQFATRDLWRDFTSQQGKHYKYSIQQYNDNQLYSNRIISNEIYSDFEDAFLYDGERQLKIKYNPKIGNIKTNILEQKTDTLGNQYPYFIRNGNVNYKEFSVSGLISYFMDNDSFFLSKEEFEVKSPTTNLIGENLSAERTFKMKVLEWLNNGKPKLFRSPTEGNFIVRLMKVTLNPENKLGRMLHTFNSTAYEIAECSYENMGKYNFIHLDNEEKQYLRWETIEFSEKDEFGKIKYKSGQILNRHPAWTVRFSDMRPGQMITITFEDDRVETFMIGATGSYYIDEGVAIRSIVLGDQNPYLPVAGNLVVDDLYLTGSMTYSYYSIQSNLFDKIADVQVTEIPTEQFIGEHNIIQEIEYINYNNKWYKNPKIEILEFYHIESQKRTEEKIIEVKEEKNIKYYTDHNRTISFDPKVADPFTFYKIGSGYTLSPTGSSTGWFGYNPHRAEYNFNASYYWDIHNNKQYSLDSYNPTIIINDNTISINDTKEFTFHRPGKLNNLITGNATNTEVSYQVRLIDYLIEEDEHYPDLYSSKKAYMALEEQLHRYFEILGFFDGYDQYGSLLEAECDSILQDLEKQYNIDIAEYQTEIKNIEVAYEEEAEIAQVDYETQWNKLNAEREYWSNQAQTEQVRENLFQVTQAINVLEYEYRENAEAKRQEKTKMIEKINGYILEIEEIYNADCAYIREKYNDQIVNLQNQKIILKAECLKNYGFDPNDYTIDKAEDFYIAYESPMRKGVKEAYNKFIYELIKAQEEEKGAEGLL